MVRGLPYRLAVLLLVSAGFGCGAGPSGHQTDREDGYSYQPPAGWNSAAVPGMKYKIAFGRPDRGFSPNINIVDEAFRGSLRDYADLNTVNMEKALLKFRILERSELRTASGDPAIRFVTENEQAGRMLRQTFYFLARGGTKYIVTCSALADGGKKLDGVFAAAVGSFTFR